MSTAEHPEAPTRRIEQLAAASSGEPESENAAVACLIGALRAEIGTVRAELGSLRSETGAVRSDLDGLGRRLTGSVAASRSETGTLVRRVAELSTRIDGVSGRVDDVRTGLPILARELRKDLEGAFAALRADVVGRDDVAAGQLAGIQTSVEAVRSQVTAVTTTLRSDLSIEIGMLTPRLDEISVGGMATGEAVRSLGSDVTGALEGLRDRPLIVTGKSVEQGGHAVAETRSAVQGTTRATREDLLARIEEQYAAVAERLGALAADVSGSTAATRESGERLAALATLSDEVRRTLDELLDMVGSSTDALRSGRLARADGKLERLDVVQGVKAVAEGVVGDLRAEVEAQLERVRQELARATEEVEVARDGLDTPTRLSRAEKALVAYLEQRDRLLETERDRVLHEVLHSFAARLPAKDWTALARRVSEPVARRRKARDAGSYHGAVSEPNPPAVEVSGEIMRLVPDDMAAAAAAREAHVAEEDLPDGPPARARGSLPQPVASAKRQAKAVTATPARKGAAATHAKAPAVTAARTKAARGKAASGQAAPAKVAPQKAARTKAAASDKAAPGRSAASGQAAPAKVAPRKAARTKAAASDKAAPGRSAASGQAAPAKVAPRKAARTKAAASDKAAPGGAAASGQAASTKAAAFPARGGTAKKVLGRGPDAETVPAEAIPAKATPAKAPPAKATLRRAALGAAKAADAARAQEDWPEIMPVKVTPAKTSRTKAARATAAPAAQAAPAAKPEDLTTSANHPSLPPPGVDQDEERRGRRLFRRRRP